MVWRASSQSTPNMKRALSFLKAHLTALALLVFIVALLSKHLDQLVTPQFYAEDGIFFYQSETVGWPSVFHVYNNYLHSPRVLSSLACSVLPWEWLPLAFNLSAALVTIAIAYRLCSARLPLYVGPLMAIALVTVLHSGEVYLNICCLHVFLGVLLMVNLLEPVPARSSETARRMGEVLVAALAGPEAIILAPFMLWRAVLWRKDVKGLLVLGAMALGAVIEGVVLVLHPRGLHGELVAMQQFLVVMPYYCQLIFAHGLKVDDVYLTGAIIMVLVSGVFAYLFSDSGNPYRLQVALLLVCAALFLIAGKLTAGWASPLGNGAHYAYLPCVMVWWALAWLLVGATCRSKRLLAASLILAIVASSATYWAADAYPDSHWRTQVAEARAGTRAQFVIYPGWGVPVPKL